MITVIKKGTPKKEITERVNEVFLKAPKRNILKYAGTLKSDIDPLDYQRHKE